MSESQIELIARLTYIDKLPVIGKYKRYAVDWDRVITEYFTSLCWRDKLQFLNIRESEFLR